MLAPLFASLDFPLIVLDLEWNQRYGKQHGDLPQEVLEIGAVKLDETLTITDQQTLMVRPGVHTVLHHHVRRITGISNAEWKEGLPFVEAAARFFAFCGEDYTLCSWGRDDLPVLWKNLEYWKLPLPTLRLAVNVQLAYDRLLGQGGGQQTSLSSAMQAFGLLPELPAHRALHDAYHTAQVLRALNDRLLRRPAPCEAVDQLLDAFSAEVLRLSERRDVLQTHCRRIGEVLTSPAYVECTCPLCDAKLAAQTPLFQAGRSQRFQQLLCCAQHGPVLSTLQAQRQRTGYFSLLRRSTLTTPETAEKVRRHYLLQPPPRKRGKRKKKADEKEQSE